MADGVRIRPRLLVASLLVAAVVGVSGGFLWERVTSDDGGADGPDVELQRETSEGAALPNVEVLDVDGAALGTGELVGEPLVVNLWYSTCVPCRREMPALAEVSEEYAGRARFVGVNMLDDAETMTEFADEVGVTYELYLDEDGAFADAVRLIGFPTTLFVDAEGTIVAQTGEVDADDIRAELAKIVA